MNLVDIELSAKELELLLDSEILPMKRRICEKMEQILLLLQKKIVANINSSSYILPKEIIRNSGRITRGDNYRSFAYRVLDCPSYFQQEDWMTYRTVVMWGHHIGFHLMLSGKYKERYGSAIASSLRDIPSGWYLTNSDNPWEWIPGDKEHIVIANEQIAIINDILNRLSFIKLSYYLPLERYSEIPSLGLVNWQLWQNKLFQKII